MGTAGSLSTSTLTLMSTSTVDLSREDDETGDEEEEEEEVDDATNVDWKGGGVVVSVLLAAIRTC